MVSFLKGRRREDDTVVAVDSNGRNVTAALEALIARAETAANDLRSLAPTLERAAEIAELRERCNDLAGQVEGALRLGGEAALRWLVGRLIGNSYQAPRCPPSAV